MGLWASFSSKKIQCESDDHVVQLPFGPSFQRTQNYSLKPQLCLASLFHERAAYKISTSPPSYCNEVHCYKIWIPQTCLGGGTPWIASGEYLHTSIYVHDQEASPPPLPQLVSLLLVTKWTRCDALVCEHMFQFLENPENILPQAFHGNGMF